jgi:hypothetical protein
VPVGSPTHGIRLALVLVCGLVVSHGHAKPACEPATGDRALALTLSVVPGGLLHGTGNLVLGRTDTALRLATLEGAGVLLIGSSMYMLFGTGGARDFAALGAVGAVSGAGLFSTSWLADVYSVAAPRGGWGRGAGRAPWWEAEVGYAYVYDPRFEYRSFLVSGFDLRVDRVRLSPTLWSSPDDSSARRSLAFAYRTVGPTRAGRVRDGTYLDLEAAATDHRLPRDRFAVTTVEWMVSGRLDLARLDENLAGSFGELGLGTAYQVMRFDGAPDASTGSAVLLARQGFGIYVGDQERSGGEWTFYYDHRHDTLAGGLLGLGIGSGVAGHLGLEGVHYLDRHWGLSARFELGSAVVTGLSARFRDFGAP